MNSLSYGVLEEYLWILISFLDDFSIYCDIDQGWDTFYHIFRARFRKKGLEVWEKCEALNNLSWKIKFFILFSKSSFGQIIKISLDFGDGCGNTYFSLYFLIYFPFLQIYFIHEPCTPLLFVQGKGLF